MQKQKQKEAERTLIGKMAAENTSTTNLTEKINHWIDKNRERIGSRILCVGTGAAPAAHLAHMFPDAAIVRLADGTDHSAGEETPDSPGLRAPLVIQADADTYQGGMFDTVISFDNTPLCPEVPGDTFPEWERGTLYLRRASLLMEYYEAKAHALCRHLRPGGMLLSLVCSEHDEYLLGYCFALAAEEMAVDPASVRQILCREDGERKILQGVTALAGARTDIGTLLAENLNFSLDRMNTAANELQGREAEIMVQADSAELVRGYHIYKEGKLMGKLAIYTSMQRPDVIYYFTDVVGDGPYLRRFHTEDQQKVLRHMVGELHRQKASDKSVEWRELKLQDGWEETEE